MVTIDIDYIGSEEDAKFESEAFGISIEIPVVNGTMAFVKGSKANLINWLMDVHHMGESEEEVLELYGL